MNIEINKIYCKTKNNIIKGYYIRFNENGNCRASNFDVEIDFENAVIIDSQYLDKIHVGFSMIIDGQFIENKEAFENSSKNIA